MLILLHLQRIYQIISKKKFYTCFFSYNYFVEYIPLTLKHLKKVFVMFVLYLFVIYFVCLPF